MMTRRSIFIAGSIAVFTLFGSETFAQDTITDRYEAENASLNGVIVFSGRGASGDQYADFQNRSSDSIEWSIVADRSGTYALSFAYAMGAAARAVRMTVNGTDVPITFPSTGSWTTWLTSSVYVSLFEGTNSVRLEAIGQSGANYDYLDVSFDNSPSSQTYRFNFSDASTPPPLGWIADEGTPFQSMRPPFAINYGWIDAASGAPISLMAFGRNRAPTPDADVLRETLMHLDHPSATALNGSFEVALPNGRYRVLIQAGDVVNDGYGRHSSRIGDRGSIHRRFRRCQRHRSGTNGFRRSRCRRRRTHRRAKPSGP
ncbi:MAG: carbohydrate-binding protein [Myxococcota bacterium]